MVLGAGDLLFVADANSDAVSVVHTGGNQETSRVSPAPYPNASLSTSPVGLVLSPDGKTLHAADAGADEVAVIGLNASGEPSQVLGRLPTAWYPTSVTVSKDSRTIWVTNGKGLGAGPNGGGADPNPTRKNPPVVDGLTGYNDGYCNCTFDKYSGSMIAGTLSAIGVPGPERLDLYTRQVARNNHFRAPPTTTTTKIASRRRTTEAMDTARSDCWWLVADQARHLHPQREPHFRSGLW
jgi:hypothetical protein